MVVVHNNTIKPKRRQRIAKFLKQRKATALLPNLFTLGNGFFGFCSIVFAAKGDYISAAYFILLGALMDSLDGRIARMLGVSSSLGLQLDSLSDAISFCLAPAFLMYFWKLKLAGPLGFIICSAFLLAGLFRLARFNITSEEQTIYFLGVPTTLAGCFLATMLINSYQMTFNFHHMCALGISVILLSYLMVSTIPFPTFKQFNKRWLIFVGLFSGAFVIIMGLIKVLFFFFIFYFFFALEHIIRTKITKNR